jgi:WD40 repeat protein/transcriptional regulator with XRE-family HTH domain
MSGIGDILLGYRKDRLLNQQEVAKELEVHHTTVSRIERNLQRPHPEYIESYIKKLRLSKAEAFALRRALNPEVVIRTDWGTCKNVVQFYGRYEHLKQLYNWTQNTQVNLVGILGMGGLGKTSLAAHFVKQNAESFGAIICRDLTNPYPALAFVHELIHALADGDAVAANTLGQAMLELINILKKKRCLLLLDNFESVMDFENVGKYKPEFLDYQSVINKLASSDHMSVVLITSRHQPENLSHEENGLVRLLHLDGLEEEACISLLDSREVEVTKEQLQELVFRFSGNPLALEIIGDLIRDIYQTDVDAYLKDWPSMRELLSDILPKQMRGLAPDEIEVLLWLAIKRRPLSAHDLDQVIEPKLGFGNIALLIKKLTNRSLVQSDVQTSVRGATLHNMIMEYLLDYLQTLICDEFAEQKYECLNRFNLIDIDAPEYIQQAQRRDMLQPILQTLQRQQGSASSVETMLFQLLAHLQAGSLDIVPRFLAGNLANLLIELNHDLSHKSLANLQLKHADFREATLHNVDLSHSNLQNCVFRDAFGHVLKVSFSPNGRFYGIATANGQVHIWEVATYEKVQIFEVDTNWVRSFDWHPTKDWIVTASSGQTTPLIKVWDIESGKLKTQFSGHKSRIRSIVYAKDGQMIVTASEDKTAIVWDSNGRILHTLEHEEVPIWSVAVHPTQTLMATAGADPTIQLWDYEVGQVVGQFEGHTDWVTAVTFNEDGTKLASGSRDGTVRLWDVKRRDSLKPFEGHEGWVRDITFRNGRKELASTGADGTIRLWNTEMYTLIRAMPAHEALVESIAASPDGELLISGSQNNEVRIWRGWECVHRAVGYKNPMWSVQFSPNSRYLLSGSSDGTMREWDVQDGQEIRAFEGHRDWVKMAAYHPTLPLFASGSSDRSIILWDRQSGRQQKKLEGHTSWISAIDFSPNGRQLASCSGDGTIRLWNGRTGAMEQELTDPNGRLWMVKFSPNGRFLASSNDKDQVLIWNARSGDLLHTLERHTESVYALAFSEDERHIYSGGADSELMVWEVATGHYQYSVDMPNPSSIWSISRQPFGDYLAVGLVDGSVRLLDINSRAQMHNFSLNTLPIWCVAFSPDGQLVASCGDGETIQIWNIETRSLVQRLLVKRPYEGLNISGIAGLNQAQQQTLIALGAKS